MTNSNKILLTALLQVEKSLVKTEKFINSNNLPLSVNFDFSNSYDLFLVITSAFNISEEKFEFLYNLLEKFYKNEISEEKIFEFIDSTNHSN